jgi:hypothetical protein
MMLNCPVCGFQMRKGDLHRGSFPCPGCNARLRWPESSRLELLAVSVAAVIVAFVVAYRLGPLEYAPLIGAVLVPVLGIPIGVAYGILRVLLFSLKLQRDSRWPDEGTVLHITGPPDPPPSH